VHVLRSIHQEFRQLLDLHGRELMVFGNRPLREITEAELRTLLNSGMAEHLQLEYKSTRYGTADGDRREFLKDICMFANATGGLLLIGVPEMRGDDGNPSGAPDPNAELGIESANPENELLAYDAQIVACIQERLVVESHAIRLENGRVVMVFRVPNSLLKPHCVRRDGHLYFFSRRDRHKYEMDLREIKEQTMRAASQLERAEQLLTREMDLQAPTSPPVLFAAQLPIFHRDFLIDITQDNIVGEMRTFNVGRTNDYVNPSYEFSGLKRTSTGKEITLHRNGLLTVRVTIPGRETTEVPNHWQFQLTSIDFLLYVFANRARQLYLNAELYSPAIFAVQILSSINLFGLWGRDFEQQTVPMNTDRRFIFPFVEIRNPADDVERTIRPICDHIHQMFGRTRSSCFGADGRWIDPRG
jgi:hypothetical protein